MPNNEFLTVSEVNSYIKAYLENNYFLNEICVKGEISNFKRHQTGTLYFSIKDNTSKINVVMFASNAYKVKAPLKDGMLVLLKGRITVYEAAGSYQIVCNELLVDSVGQLYMEYERLKKQLESEGLFDSRYKKQIPAYPTKIGIITAPKGAAIHDMVNTINLRWPLADIILFPSLVQGVRAAEDIVRNIKIADSYGVDVIICGRGGGSIEDLWPFNEEIVARAIFNCKTPIISAVGHQSDFTIADFVADRRGLTPTDGAVIATPDLKKVLEQLKDKNKLLTQAMLKIYEKHKARLEQLKKSYIFKHPEKLYETYRLKLENLETTMFQNIQQLNELTKRDLKNKIDKINNSFNSIYKQNQHQFITLVAKLDALSPLKILKRGYSVAFKDNKSLKSVNDVAIDDEIKLQLSDGKIINKVIAKEK